MRRYFVLLLAAFAAGLPTAGGAQDYPTRQITLIAPWPAGGAVDAVCRAVAPHLSDRLGKSVVVENRPGAGSVIGTAAGAKASPDGYTMVMAGSGSLAISATMYKKLPYDPVKDLIPLTLGAKIPFVLVVNPALPVHSVAELVKYAKDNPGKLSFASGGPGSPHHLYGELLKSMTGIEMTHVPYKGSAPALADLIGGHVAIYFSSLPPAASLVKEGKVRALAVTGGKRSAILPDLPTVAESGLSGYEAVLHYGIAAPAGTPRPIIDKLNAALVAALANDEVIARMATDGTEPLSGTPEQYAADIDREETKWSRIVKISGAKVE